MVPSLPEGPLSQSINWTENRSAGHDEDPEDEYGKSRRDFSNAGIDARLYDFLARNLVNERQWWACVLFGRPWPR
jgi:hypothetical protein